MGFLFYFNVWVNAQIVCLGIKILFVQIVWMVVCAAEERIYVMNALKDILLRIRSKVYSVKNVFIHVSIASMKLNVENVSNLL
jgi:hypothetical protein